VDEADVKKHNTLTVNLAELEKQSSALTAAKDGYLSEYKKKQAALNSKIGETQKAIQVIRDADPEIAKLKQGVKVGQ